MSLKIVHTSNLNFKHLTPNSKLQTPNFKLLTPNSKLPRHPQLLKSLAPRTRWIYGVGCSFDITRAVCRQNLVGLEIHVIRGALLKSKGNQNGFFNGRELSRAQGSDSCSEARLVQRPHLVTECASGMPLDLDHGFPWKQG